MLATLDRDGVLIIRPESEVEVFALTHWVNQAVIPMKSYQHNEEQFVRGSRIIIETQISKEKP